MRPAYDAEGFEGNFRIVNVGGDGVENTQDDTIYRGALSGYSNGDGTVTVSFSDEIAGYEATDTILTFVSDDEIEGTVEFSDGIATFVQSVRMCPEAYSDSASSASTSGDMHRRYGSGRDTMQNRPENAYENSAEDASMQRVGVRRFRYLSQRLQEKLDERLDEIPADRYTAVLERVIVRVDALIENTTAGTKRAIFLTEIRDYLQMRVDDHTDEDLIDEIFSDETDSEDAAESEDTDDENEASESTTDEDEDSEDADTADTNESSEEEDAAESDDENETADTENSEDENEDESEDDEDNTEEASDENDETANDEAQEEDSDENDETSDADENDESDENDETESDEAGNDETDGSTNT